jgi:trehalose 2-sulfotransferase
VSSLDPGPYFIAATARTGSFLLCDLIAQSNVAGYPQEYALAEDVSTWRDFHRYLTHAEYFFRLREECTTPNGVFGLKLMWPQMQGLLDDLRRYLRVSGGPARERLGAWFGGDMRVLRIARRSRLRQALSLVRAMQTGRWSTSATAGLPASGHYDPDAIEAALGLLRKQESAWSDFLSEWSSVTHWIWYEDLVADPRGTLAGALGWLGQGLHEGFKPEPRLRRQADHLTEEWLMRYLNEPVRSASESWR